jgi:fyn-related kinase
MLNPLNSYGSYLIRGSEGSVGSHVLSIRDKNKVKHYRIYRSENGEFFITTSATFKTLQDLVIHYQQEADGLCVNLKKPCVFTPPTDVSGNPIDKWQTDKLDIRFVRKLTSGEFIAVGQVHDQKAHDVSVVYI